jgi:predicted nucleic acid-binding Zn ribbon protein
VGWADEDNNDIDAPQDMDLDDAAEGGSSDECPICGRTIAEGASRCPHCGQWLFGETAAGQRARGWFWPVMVALLVALILVLWHGLGRWK